MGVLCVVSIPRFTKSANNNKEQGCNVNLAALDIAIELYAVDHDGVYPSNITDVSASLVYFPDGSPSCALGGTYSLSSNRAVCNH